MAALSRAATTPIYAHTLVRAVSARTQRSTVWTNIGCGIQIKNELFHLRIKEPCVLNCTRRDEKETKKKKKETASPSGCRSFDIFSHLKFSCLVSMFHHITALIFSKLSLGFFKNPNRSKKYN